MSEYFTYKIFPMLILILGLIGNTIGLVALSNKKLIKIGPIIILRFLFTMDSIYLITIFITYVDNGIGLKYISAFSIACKLFKYICYSLDSISPWLLSYISIDRLVSIKNITKWRFLKNNTFQILYFLALLIFNLVYYLPIAFYSDNLNIADKNETNMTLNVCVFTDPQAQIILSFLDVFNLLLIPFSIMFVSSIILIITIYISRKRAQSENEISKKDIRFSITSISFNIGFLVLNLPLAIVCFFTTNFSDYTFYTTYYLFYASYAINFYIILFSNKLFRSVVFDMMEVKTVQPQSACKKTLTNGEGLNRSIVSRF